MDLIIKNLESLKYFEGKPQPKTITIDIKKVIEDSVEFSETFEKSCEKYVKIGESYLVPIEDINKEIESNWKPAEPTLKEATEHMKSEFDVTGKDIKVFLDGAKERR